MYTVIVVGSTNPDKVEATKRAYARAFSFEAEQYRDQETSETVVDFEVIGTVVRSGVRDQPLTIAETKRGAKNRAFAAWQSQPMVSIGVGIEGGIFFDDGVFFNQAWIVVYTQDDAGRSKWSITGSDCVPVPSVLVDKIRSGIELSHAVDEVLVTSGSKNNGGWHSVFSNGKVDIPSSIERALVSAFEGLKLNEELFGSIHYF
jgi:inosine/xanthosine triphosphatase